MSASTETALTVTPTSSRAGGLLKRVLSGVPCKAKYEKRGGEVLLDAVADASVVPMLTEHPSVSLVPRADGHSLLCFDIDSLDDAGGAATAGPFAGVRLAAGLLVFDAFLTAVLQLPLTLIALSGKKGVHAYVARSFPEADRRGGRAAPAADARWLPTRGARLCRRRGCPRPYAHRRDAVARPVAAPWFRCCIRRASRRRAGADGEQRGPLCRRLSAL